jgi:predicted  nucleic acid-binding Zn-ribbon protein
MSKLQAILNYQEVDKRLLKLENEFADSEERKKYVKLQKFLKTAPEKLDALEVKATSLQAEVEKLVQKYEQTEATLGDFDNLEELLNSGADVSFYKKKAQSVAEQLRKLKLAINALVDEIKNTDAEYQKLKKQVISAQKQYAEASESYKAVKAKNEEERKAIESELSAIQKEVDESLLARYLTKRKEKLFPIVGELYSGRCPFCSMAPSIEAKSKIADGIECDTCHRIIFEK